MPNFQRSNCDSNTRVCNDKESFVAELIEEDEYPSEVVGFNQYGEIIKPRIMTRHLTGQIKTASRRRKLGFSRYGEIE